MTCVPNRKCEIEGNIISFTNTYRYTDPVTKMPALTSREHLGVRLLCSIQIELMHKAKNVAYTYSNSQAIATPVFAECNTGNGAVITCVPLLLPHHSAIRPVFCMVMSSNIYFYNKSLAQLCSVQKPYNIISFYQHIQVY